MAASEPWITLGRGYEASQGIIQDPTREVYVARDETGLAGFLILCMTGAFVGYTQTNLDARRLYQRLGYKVVGELTDYIVRGHSEFLLRSMLGPLTGFSSKATAGKTSQGTG